MKKTIRKLLNQLLLRYSRYSFNKGIHKVVTIKKDVFLSLVPKDCTPPQVFSFIPNLENFLEFNKKHAYYENEIGLLKHKLSQLGHNAMYLVEANNSLANKHDWFFVHYSNSNGVDDTNYRETCSDFSFDLCTRLRYGALLMNHLVPKLFAEKDFNIYITENETPFVHYLKEHYKQDITTSAYFGNDVNSGTIVGNVPHQDLTRLSFKDNSFDMVLCFEDLEHIPDYQAAIRELYRITSEEGVLLISVPFNKMSPTNIERASVNTNGEIVHHMEPEYHGDPVAKTGILCFRHYGWEFLDELRNLGFKTVTACTGCKADELIFGDNLFIVCSKKGLS